MLQPARLGMKVFYAPEHLLRNEHGGPWSFGEFSRKNRRERLAKRSPQVTGNGPPKLIETQLKQLGNPLG